MLKGSFFGLDLTSSEQKPSAYATLGPEARLLDLDVLGSDTDIMACLRQTRPSLVAIDAPLSLPQGLCCLEEACPCQAPRRVRDCERELARLGIGCYFTTKGSIIKRMVYRAIKLKQSLSDWGFTVLEVYPYAAKVRLWGKPIPKKTTRDGLNFLKEHLAQLIPGLDPQTLANHDLCDAVVAAYTAHLHSQGRTQAVGDEQEGLIYLPA